MPDEKPFLGDYKTGPDFKQVTPDRDIREGDQVDGARSVPTHPVKHGDPQEKR